jgi:hypothetical protein
MYHQVRSPSRTSHYQQRQEWQTRSTIALVHPCDCSNLAVSSCDATKWRNVIRRGPNVWSHLRGNLGIPEMMQWPVPRAILLKLLLMLSVRAVRLQVVAGNCWRNYRIPSHSPPDVSISNTCILCWC